MPISGTIVIGPDDGDVLTMGSDVGAGGEAFDLAVDPLEGRGVVARGGTGAMSMLAVGPPGSLLKLPDMYMRRMAVGPRARDSIDLTRPVAENVRCSGRSPILIAPVADPLIGNATPSIRAFPSPAVAARRLIGGEPIKLAMKTLSGRR